MNDKSIPIPVERALKQVGENISLARRARGWSQQDFAQRLNSSLSTVRRLESGFHGAALHIFFRALHLLGLLDDLVNLTSIENDKLGAALLQRELPKHIHSKSGMKTKSSYQVQEEHSVESSFNHDELEGF